MPGLFLRVSYSWLSKDKNVFRNIFGNRVFLGIFGFTIVLQAIIVEFGSSAFKLDPHGLDGLYWLYSILIGTGSLLVGFLIRLLPDFNVPIWMLGGSTQKEAESLMVIEEAIPTIIQVVDEGNLPKDQWAKAIKQTRLQVRVIKLFTLPPSAKNSPSIAHEPIEIVRIENGPDVGSSAALMDDKQASASGWDKVRLYFSTVAAFRHSRDLSNTMMISPRKLRDAQIAAARKKH